MAYITNRLRREVIEAFIRTFSDTRHYMFAARSYPYDDEMNPEEVDRSPRYQEYDLYRDIIFGKYISPEDVVPMAKKVVWEAGKVYDFYDDIVPEDTDKVYIVTAMENDGSASVFKCINNRLDGQTVETTHKPTRDEVSVDDEFYMTNDGYQWKFLYNVSANIMRKFSTEKYIPVIEDSRVKERAVPGSIETYIVETPGANYNSWTHGSVVDPVVAGNTLIYGITAHEGLNLSSNSDFYNNSAVYITSGRGAGQVKKIVDYIVAGTARRIMVDSPFEIVPDLSSTISIAPAVEVRGDGNNAVAVAVINPLANSISHIEVVKGGEGYSFAEVTLTGNTGFINPEITNTATIRPILSPSLGHGGDVISETRASAVGISVTFDKDENGNIPTTGEYRTFGVIKNPYYREIEIGIDPPAIAFDDGETIHQPSSNAYGTVYYRLGEDVILTDVRGQFMSSDSVVGLTSNTHANVLSVNGDVSYFDNRTIFQIEMMDTGPLGNGFLPNEEVYQEDTGAVGIVHSVTPTHISLVNVKGIFDVSDSVTNVEKTFIGRNNGAVAKLISRKDKDIIPSSGNALYIENTFPINRDPAQSENAKLIVEL